jgi:hypothetical protein
MEKYVDESIDKTSWETRQSSGVFGLWGSTPWTTEFLLAKTPSTGPALASNAS